MTPISTETLWHAAPVAAAAGLLLAAVAGVLTYRRRGTVPNEPADPTVGHSPVYRCTGCGWLTAHARTPHGLVCRRCGAIGTEAGT